MRIIKSILLLSFLLAAPSVFAADDTGKNLAKFVKDPYPWLHIEAYSEQHQPIYLGRTPREMSLRIPPADGGNPVLYQFLKTLGQTQAKQVRDALIDAKVLNSGVPVYFEVWPAQNEYGQLTWVFARWRSDPAKPWQRLNASILPTDLDRSVPRPVLPISPDPSKKTDFSDIFDDASTRKSLYDKPFFGDCVWATGDGVAMDAWLPLDKREELAREVVEDIKKMGSSLTCRVLPQPARLNGKPVTFIIKFDAESISWPKNIQWKAEGDIPAETQVKGDPIKDWPADFIDQYKEDVLVLSGAKEAVFPVTGRKMIFKNKNNMEKDNQLGDVISYLEERYAKDGIKTWRQSFDWRGMKQSNLVAVIPGTDPSLPPVLLADHIDTAISQDILDRTAGAKAVSSAGADDNCSATAAMLRAAPILKSLGLRREIWLVHLTGEEFPADSLGARYFVSKLLKEKKDLSGVILMDMIGRRAQGDKAFQVNPGESSDSLKMASMASGLARLGGELEPVVIKRFDPRSRLAASDGLIFSDGGFPVVCLSEHINRPEDFRRRGPHNSDDTADRMDWEYAAAISKLAIRLACAAASAEPPARMPSAQPDWSIIIYAGFDVTDLSKAYNPRLKELLGSQVPDNAEILIERDTDWPDGSVRIIRTGDSHEESGMAEQDSASPETFYNFLRWADANAKGKYRALVIQGNSWGWRGVVQDYTVPSQRGKNTIMPLREMARAASASGFKPDVVIFDAGVMGNAEPIEELKGMAPYLVVSEFETPYNGMPVAGFLKLAAEPGIGPAELAKRFPEEYVKSYGRDGAMSSRENEYFVVTMAAIDTAAWDVFTGKFKGLVGELSRSGFRKELQTQPGWARSFADKNTNADLIEFLKRLPLLTDDPAVKASASEILDDIGYPERASAENAATITLDPSKVRSFELRIDACPYPTKDKALRDTLGDWNHLNQDLKLPETFVYDISDFRQDGKRREFIVRCPEDALKKPVTFRMWLPGAKYAILTTVDKEAKISTRKFFREKDYVAVSDLPPTSFILSEAHSQGSPFVHGVGLVLDPEMAANFDKNTDALTGLSGRDFYKTLAWCARTGWADLMLSAPPPESGKQAMPEAKTTEP